MRLAARAVTVRFGARTILDRIDAAMTTGEFVGLIGPNGAGKTTLLRALAHLLVPDAGEITCDGLSLAGLGAGERARRIAYLEQGGAVHWPMRVEKLVALGRLPHRSPARPLSGSDCDAVRRAMEATDVARFTGRTMATLSGGERLRVLLARAIAVEAPFLLVDEPIAELDPSHQLQVMDFLRRTARRGVGVVAVLHDLTLAARFSDRLLLLHDGGVVAEGRPEAVLSDANLRAAYGITAMRGHHAGEPYIVPWEQHRPTTIPATHHSEIP